MNGNGPEGIISLPGASQITTDLFKEKLNSTIMTGKDQFGISRRIGHRMPVVGNDNVKFTPLSFPSKDMEIIDQQQWFTKVLWMQFGVTPSEMGFTEDASKNVDENQSKIAIRRGVKPILDNIAFHLNTQIINELDDKNMFEFKWDESDIGEEIQVRTLQEQEIRMGLKSWQMIAEEEGLDINRLQKDKDANMEAEQQFSFSPMDGKENPKPTDDKKKVEEKSVEVKAEDVSLEDIFNEVADEIENVGKVLVDKVKEK
jgi:phage portal protein BeeE